MEKYGIMVKGIVKYKDKYLVVKKWYDDRVAEPYQWGFIDGRLDSSEAPDKAVIRNIYEQTGLSATIQKLLYTWTFSTGDVFHIGISYLCQVTLDNVILSEELADYRFISKEEFENYLEEKVLTDIQKVDL